MTRCQWLLVLSNSTSYRTMCRLKCEDRQASLVNFSWNLCKAATTKTTTNINRPQMTFYLHSKSSSKLCDANVRAVAHHKDVLVGGISWHVWAMQVYRTVQQWRILCARMCCKWLWLRWWQLRFRIQQHAIDGTWLMTYCTTLNFKFNKCVVTCTIYRTNILHYKHSFINTILFPIFL